MADNVIDLAPALGRRVADEDRAIERLLQACSDAAERGDFAAVQTKGRAYHEVDTRARTRIRSACRVFGDA